MTSPKMAPPTSRPAGPGGAIPLSPPARPPADLIARLGDLGGIASIALGILATTYGGIAVPHGAPRWPLLAGLAGVAALAGFAVVCWYAARALRINLTGGGR